MTLWILPIALQALAMLVDEGWFHRERGLPVSLKRWNVCPLPRFQRGRNGPMS